MKTKVRRIMALLRISSLVLLLVFTASKGYAGDEQKFLDLLHSQGFQYAQGSLIFPDVLSLCCSCEVPSCWGNNASSTYGMYLLPAAPGQTALNPNAEAFSTPSQPNLSAFWRLRADEAIVFIGKTPPRMSYFGFTSYLYDRAGTPSTNAPCPLKPSLSQRSPEVFASLHDTINNKTIQCSGPEWDPFSKDTIIITTADRGIANTVRAALVQAGYPLGIINLDVIPSGILKLGIEQSSDSLSFLARVAPMNEDSRAFRDYIQNPGNLWRLTPGIVTPPSRLDPYPVPKLRVKGTGRTELGLLSLVEDLRLAILARYTPGYEPVEIPTTNLMEGYNCIQQNENCLADNRDAAYVYGNPSNVFTLAEDEFVIIYGVNHVLTGKAIYSNFTVTGGVMKVGAASVRNNQFPGSAQYYLSGNGDVMKLYAWKIMRQGQCGDEPYCLEITDSCATGGVPLDQPMSVAARAYVERQTEVGAAYAELVLDRIIKFTPSTK